jgi:hypothetical protein
MNPNLPSFNTFMKMSCSYWHREKKYMLCETFISFSGGRSRTTYHGQETGKLDHLQLRVQCTLFCNLQSWVRTHAVLVIGFHELLSHTRPSKETKKEQDEIKFIAWTKNIYSFNIGMYSYMPSIVGINWVKLERGYCSKK